MTDYPRAPDAVPSAGYPPTPAAPAGPAAPAAPAGPAGPAAPDPWAPAGELPGRGGAADQPPQGGLEAPGAAPPGAYPGGPDAEAVVEAVVEAAVARLGGGRHKAGRRRPGAAKGPQSALARLAKDAAFVIVSALVLSFLLKTFLIQSFYIPSESMVPTLEELDRVVVTKLAPGLLEVHRGDIVVFHDPGGWVTQAAPPRETSPVTETLRQVAQAIGLTPADSEGFLIKRVIGVGGDEVACAGEGWPVTVNGVPLDETYVAPGAAPSVAAFEVVVPAGAVWVMGDNRGRSADSRAHMAGSALGGAVSLDLVVGVAQLRTWPLGRFGLLRNPGSVFATVPNLNGGQ